MVKDVLLLFVSLPVILLSAEIFTNSVESLGRRLSLSQAVVGSILAAIGTALPETILPLVAILMNGGDAAKKIGVGAILGAPFMLSTLAFFFVGVSAVFRSIRRSENLALELEIVSIRRDLLFFIAFYSLAIIVPLFVHRGHAYMAALLPVGYVVYAYRTFKGESAGIMHVGELYVSQLVLFVRRFFTGTPSQYTSSLLPDRQKLTASLFLILTQVILALILMIGGAHVFVKGLEEVSRALNMNPLLFALLIAPVATELPEKFNSITWTLKGRDALAMGNITGAMVFQSTFPVAIGLLFTEWNVSGLPLLSAFLALLSAVVLIVVMHFRRRVSPFAVLTCGSFYVLYVVAILLSR